jgi:hypothetical protein
MLAFTAQWETYGQRTRASIRGILQSSSCRAAAFTKHFALLLVLPVGFSLSAAAQTARTFEGLDSDSNGQLSPAEFGKLPGFYGSLELFTDLDKGNDRAISREEWFAGSPDESGVPLGRNAAAREAMRSGARAGTRPASVRHGSNLPREPVAGEKKYEPLSDAAYRQLLTGRGGSAGPKRPAPQPRIPPRPPVIPPDVLPPR